MFTCELSVMINFALLVVKQVEFSLEIEQHFPELKMKSLSGMFGQCYIGREHIC
jgi:hypothetical protein